MILLYLAVAAAYLAAAWLEWKLLAEPARAAPARWTAATSWLAAAALAGHLFIVARAIFLVDKPDLSLVNALSMVGGLAALFAWLGSLSRALPGATAIAFPVAAIALLLSAAFSNPHPFPLGEAPFARAHVAIALVAYALLIVAALQASVLIGLEKRLHRGLPEPRAASMPPLLTLERFLFRIVSAGFILLTLTLASGILFSEELFGKPLTFTHKTVFSVLSWLAYAALLLGRYRFGWRGRTALNWILIASVLLVLAYIGSKFVLEVVLHR
jgi:ABC-type uncharacterized transport system permease subunit